MRKNILHLVIALALGGCVNTYIDQRSQITSGQTAARVAVAQGQYNQVKAQNDQLKAQQQDIDDKLVSTRRDIDRLEQRNATLMADLAKARQSLDQARKTNKISQTDYEMGKRDLDRLNQEAQALDLQLKAGDVLGDEAAAKKQAEIAALEKKKAELEKALQLTGKN